LLVGRLVGPAELAGPLQREDAGRLLRLAPGLGNHGLREHTARAAVGVEEGLELVEAGGVGGQAGSHEGKSRDAVFHGTKSASRVMRPTSLALLK
jgi:hypothetical protein